MYSYLEFTQLVNRRCGDKMRRFSSIFAETFNLCHIWYYKLNDSGDLSFTGTFTDWNEIFASEKLYLTYLCHPQFFVPGVAIRRDVQNPHIKQVCESWERRFGTHQTLVITNQISDGIEEFGFTSPYINDSQTEIFLNDISVFKLFIRKFKEETKLIHQVNDIQINVASLIGPEFHTDKIRHSKMIDKRSLLKKMGIEVGLSPKEIEVLQWVLLGYSAKEIGLKAHIAKRTVEHHAERIKMRLGCSSKAQLIQKARELESLGCLKN
jgi:DNA-binding CsgD family transcriptional regulator